MPGETDINTVNTTRERVNALIWKDDPETLGKPGRWLLTMARMAHVLARDLAAGHITMRAMGLVYTSLLFLVTLLALAFSLLKAFGMDNTLRPLLERFLAPLGPRAAPLIDAITEFVANVQVGVLGAAGLVILLYSVVSLIQKIEAGCNAIWEVHSPRPLGRRFTEYLSVLIVGPLVIVAATSITASLASTTVVDYLRHVQGFGTVLYMVGHLMPYVMYSAAFTVLYSFMPNTRVHALPALGGGVFAGVLWQTASVVFTTFAANAGNVNAIYSSFAIVILLLIWLYVSWLIMLVGCRVAFLLQHQEQLTRRPYPPALNSCEREELALLVSSLVARGFVHGEPLCRSEQLAHRLRVPPAHIHDVVDQLIAADILIETDHAAAGLLPRRDIAELEANDVINAVRGVAARRMEPSGDLAQHRERIAMLLDRSEKARKTVLGRLTLRELATAEVGADFGAAVDGDSTPPICATAHHTE